MLIAIITNELRWYYIRNVRFAIGLKIVHTKKREAGILLLYKA